MAKKNDEQIDDYYLTAQLFLNKQHLADVDLKQLATLHETPTVNENVDGTDMLADIIDVALAGGNINKQRDPIDTKASKDVVHVNSNMQTQDSGTEVVVDDDENSLKL